MRPSSRRPKEYILAALYAMFFGIFAVDRFYLGYYATGVLKLITLGGLGIWALIDVIVLLAGKRRAKDGSELSGYEQAKVMSWVAFGCLVLQIALFFSPLEMLCFHASCR